MPLAVETLPHPQSRPGDPGDLIIRDVLVGVTRLSLLPFLLSLFMRLDQTESQAL